MSTCIIVNPNAGSADQLDALEGLVAHRDDIVLWKSTEADSCPDLAEKAVREGFDVIAAAGGDGTVNAVVNGLVRSGLKARFGLVPLGTGNDLARTLAIPPDPLDAIAVLEVGEVHAIDLIRADSDGQTIYAINAAAGGFSGQVNEALSSELKAAWGPLAYLIGAVTTIPEIQNHKTYLTYDDEEPEEVDAFNIIVANGRTVAGGKNVAPMANPEDGLLDVVIVRYGAVLKLAEVGARLLVGNYLQSNQVVHRAASRIHVASEPGMWFNVDGELLGDSPITFSVEHRALEVVVGTDYRADPET